MLRNIKAYLTGKPITIVVLFGIFIRLILVALYWNVTIFPDSDEYVFLADYLINPNSTEYTGVRAPGYPLLIFVVNSYLPAVVILQFIIGIITSVYIYKILELLRFRQISAIIITLLVSSMIHALFYETAILTETLTLLFIALIFYFTLKIFFHNDRGWKNMLILGLLLGYLTFIKPFYIFIPFLIYGLYTITGFKFSRIINRMAVILIFPIIAIISCMYMNYVHIGKFVTTSIYGFSSAQNCVYYAEKGPEEYRDIMDIYVKHREEAISNNQDVAMTIWYAKEEMHEKTGLNLLELSDRLNSYGKATIKDNPLDYCKQVLLSWREFWGTSIYWNYDRFNFKYANKACLAIWYVESFVLQLLKILFVLTIPYHIFLYLRKRKMTPELIIVAFVFVTSVMQAMVTFGTNSRFSYPFEFLMIIGLLLTFEKVIKIPLLKLK